ncbi:MAG: hypothetical protein AAGC73_10305 [Verrucomicrobiota bacterium]
MESVRTESGKINPFEDFRHERRWLTILALVLAILFHLALWGAVVILGPVLPKQLSIAKSDPPLEVELVQVVEETKPEEQRYVETNPKAPENEPDETDQYSAKAQQAADQNPESGPDETPTVDGDSDNLKILQGEVAEPTPVEPGVYAAQAPEGEGPGDAGGKPVPPSEAEVSQAPPLPPPDFLRQEPESDDGVSSRLEIPDEVPEEVKDPQLTSEPINVYQPQEDSEVVQATEPRPGGGQATARPAPRARPRLPPELTHGPLLRSRSSATIRGDLAIDATFSEFGEYQQQFYAALQAGWYQEIEFFEPIDTSTYVRVRFKIRSDGSIRDVETLDSTASEIARVICETAITKRSPFRPWTKEMVKVFGRERTLTVVFRYL